MELTADYNAKRIFSHKQLAVLIGPLMVEQLLSVGVGMIDSVMVAGEGDTVLSAVCLVDSLNNLILVILTALATGGAVVCSQYLGHRQPVEARKSAGQLLLANVGLAIVLSLIMVLLGSNLLTLLFGTVEEELMDAAMDYYVFIVLCYPFLAIYNSGAAILRSTGNSSISMKTALLMNGVNMIGNAILIYGCQLSAAGAAIATLIARITGAAVMLVIMHNRKRTIYLEKLLSLRPDFRAIRKILSVGIPTGTENGIFQLGKVIVSSLVSTFGTASIMANSVANIMCMFMIIPGSAVSLALITIVGQCVGAGRIDEARRCSKLLIAASTVMDTLVGLIIYLACPLLLGIFNMSDEAREIATVLIFWHVIAGLIWPTSFNTPNILRAANDARYTMVASMISMWLIRVACSYFFANAFGLGIYGVWLAMFADWVLRSILFLRRFKGTGWYKRKLIDD